MKKLLKNKVVKSILSALAVAISGFILLNLTFLFDFLFQSVVRGLLSLITPVDLNMANWFPPLMHLMFLVIIGIISWFIFRSKLGLLYKATYMTVPLAVVFATLGIFFYQWPPVVYALSTLFFICILYYLYKTKQPWLYYYTLILVGLVMLLVGIFAVEI